MVADGVEWGSGGTYGFSDNDFINFTDVVNIYDEVDGYYTEAVSSLVVMDIADFLEDWDDAGKINYRDEYETISWGDRFRAAEISPAPELIDGSWDEDTEIGQVTLVYNITDAISADNKQKFADEQGIENLDGLSVTAFITFKGELNWSNDFYVKASLKLVKTGEDAAIEAVRDNDDWTETLTTLERKGARLKATNTNTQGLSSLGIGMLGAIVSAISSGGNNEYDIVANDKIITSIGDYKIANDLTISLGRKESKSSLLEEKYSFDTNNASYTLSDWLTSSGPLDAESAAASAGQYSKLVIEAGGRDGTGVLYMEDYEKKIRNLLNDMRDRVMTSQYRNSDDIQDMIDSYLKADAIKYKDLTKWAEQHVSEVVKIQQLDEMCDALSPNRRTAASMGVKMLAREFILESVLISLQVFDTFGTGFMESEAFRQTIFDNIKTEMKKYSNSFEDTVKNNIFSDIKDAAVKYYEYRSLLGDEVEISTGANTLISIIGEEISEIRESITSSLQLSETRSWNDFVLDEILPATGLTVVMDYNDAEQYYFVEVRYHEDSVPLFSSRCGGTAEEGSIDGGETTEDLCGDESESNIVAYGKYITVREQLINNEEYKEFINHVFPFRELVTQLSVYQASALSDVAVFPGTYEGRNFFDIFAETKLSTLQTLLASIHGAGETTYIDPFLEKLKT
jgi:hypothetical protein